VLLLKHGLFALLFFVVAVLMLLLLSEKYIVFTCKSYCYCLAVVREVKQNHQYLEIHVTFI